MRDMTRCIRPERLPPQPQGRRRAKVSANSVGGAAMALSLLALALSACTPATHDMHDGGMADAGAQATEALSASGAWRVGYTSTPAPVPLNEPFDLRVTLARTDGQPMPEGTVIEVDAAMPAHNHGMTTQPVATREADGTYSVDGMLFHMAGAWELYVDVREGDAIDRATFDIVLAE